MVVERSYEICRNSDVKSNLKKNDTIVVVCHHGIRSRIVGKHLDSCGFKNIINLIGGVDRWSKEIDLNMKKYV